MLYFVLITFTLSLIYGTMLSLLIMDLTLADTYNVVSLYVLLQIILYHIFAQKAIGKGYKNNGGVYVKCTIGALAVRE
ncbi:hypothetical protein DW964_06430 [Ruminococcus sp. AM47-2BH]|nr:hypothetical protein DW964_06430 [Ruminococcus sp. AM47-2BH]